MAVSVCRRIQKNVLVNGKALIVDGGLTKDDWRICKVRPNDSYDNVMPLRLRNRRRKYHES